MEGPGPKIQMCSFCKNHGRFVSRKGHKECPHKDCGCGACGLVRDINRGKRERAQERAIERRTQGVKVEPTSPPTTEERAESAECRDMHNRFSNPIDLTSPKKDHTDFYSCSRPVEKERDNQTIDLTSKSHGTGSNKPDPLFRKKLSKILPTPRKPINTSPGRPHHENQAPIKTEPVEIKTETPWYYSSSMGASSKGQDSFDTTGWTLTGTQILQRSDSASKKLSSVKKTSAAKAIVLPIVKADKSPKFTDTNRESPVHQSSTTEAASSASSSRKSQSAKGARKQERQAAELKDQKPRKKSTNDMKEPRKSAVKQNIEIPAAEASASVPSRSIFGKAFDLITSFAPGRSSVSSEPTAENTCNAPPVTTKGKNIGGRKRTSGESTVELIRKKPKRFCPRCGENVGKMDNFCGECCFRL